jgi:ABC-type glutathione transport system ATPase component
VSCDYESARFSEPLLRVRGLSKDYVQGNPFSTQNFSVRALDGADLVVRRGTTLAVIGESGAGKSTLARCLALLEPPTAGEIWLEARKVTALGREERSSFHRKVQLIFQDPASSLDPRLSAAEIVEEPLRIQKEGTPAERRGRALEMMERVGLPTGSGDKRPVEFSGGQRQRLALARALVLAPQLLILDEALSGLDPFHQAVILGLLEGLQRSLALTYIHICHDLRLAQGFADEIAVLHRGQVVEQNTAAALFDRPRHAYTRALIGALPPVESVLARRLALECQ